MPRPADPFAHHHLAALATAATTTALIAATWYAIGPSPQPFLPGEPIMVEWLNEVPAQREYSTIQLMRVPTSNRLIGIALNHTLDITTTHWDGRRTGPCTGANCPHCRNGHPGRIHAFVPLYSQSSGKIAVIQLTDIAAGALQEEARRYKGLRGLLLQISRVQPRDNARILIEARKLPVDPPDLPEPIDVRRFMASIWNSNAKSTNQNGQSRTEPHPAE